jgi:hypothetical protein
MSSSIFALGQSVGKIGGNVGIFGAHQKIRGGASQGGADGRSTEVIRKYRPQLYGI